MLPSGSSCVSSGEFLRHIASTMRLRTHHAQACSCGSPVVPSAFCPNDASLRAPCTRMSLWSLRGSFGILPTRCVSARTMPTHVSFGIPPTRYVPERTMQPHVPVCSCPRYVPVRTMQTHVLSRRDLSFTCPTRYVYVRTMLPHVWPCTNDTSTYVPCSRMFPWPSAPFHVPLHALLPCSPATAACLRAFDFPLLPLQTQRPPPGPPYSYSTSRALRAFHCPPGSAPTGRTLWDLF